MTITQEASGMTPNQARAALPGGTDRLVTFTGASGKPVEIHVTVIEHDRDAVYVGAHPAMLCLPYADLLAVRRVAS
jgi:hypothetical protein